MMALLWHLLLLRAGSSNIDEAFNTTCKYIEQGTGWNSACLHHLGRGLFSVDEVSDEWNHSFVQGRDTCIYDWLADTLT